jgi:hypothetical protein
VELLGPRVVPEEAARVPQAELGLTHPHSRSGADAFRQAPDTFEDGEIGKLQSIVPGSGPRGVTKVGAHDLPVAAALYEDQRCASVDDSHLAVFRHPGKRVIGVGIPLVSLKTRH